VRKLNKEEILTTRYLIDWLIIILVVLWIIILLQMFYCVAMKLLYVCVQVLMQIVDKVIWTILS